MTFSLFNTASQLTMAAADFIAFHTAAAVERNGVCSLVLAGGSTPAPAYRCLASVNLPWKSIHLFWGDERQCPPDSSDSNYHMVDETLLRHISIPGENVHRIHTEFSAIDDSAADYERDIRNYAAEYPHPDDQSRLVPSFDLAVLGIGSDGHTASLFPGSPALNETEHLVVATGIPGMEPKVRRITMTIPLLNNAHTVLFLASGPAKQPIIQAMQENLTAAAKRYPAARIAGHNQTVLYYSP